MGDRFFPETMPSPWSPMLLVHRNRQGVRGALARSWCEVMSFVQLRVVASGITFQAEALMADLALSFSRSKSLSVTRGYCWALFLRVRKISTKHGKPGYPCEPSSPWTLPECESVLRPPWAPVIAKGLFNPDLMCIRNTLKKADSKPGGKIPIDLHRVLVWFAVWLWGWGANVWAALYWRGHAMLPRLPSSEV